MKIDSNEDLNIRIKGAIPAFDMLLETLEIIIPALNHQTKQLMDEKNYPEAKEVIAKAEAVITFQAKVRALRDEWVMINVPPTKKQTHTRKKKSARSTPSKLRKGLRTSDKEFRMPILNVLVSLGGSANRQRVFDELERNMSDQLNTYDWMPLPSNSNITRWKNTAAWARQSLVKDGFIASDSPTGIWEITAAGRRALEDSKKKGS